MTTDDTNNVLNQQIKRGSILPQQLPYENEHSLLSSLKHENNERVKATIIEHNLFRVIDALREFKGGNIEDLISIGTIGLIKAVNTFDVDSETEFGTVCVGIH